MGIESSFDARLWDVVGKPYEERNYTAVILDSIQYLGDVIREKTGLASDGMSLVGEALSGAKPRLRVNRFETETDKNVQGGIEHLVRGLYKAFRNPRSHEKHVDSQDDAHTVLLLVTYLLKVIGQAKSPFERTSFLQRVFDPEFVENVRYADLLAAEVPSKHRLDILIHTYRERETGVISKLKYIVSALWKLLSEEARAEFAGIVSEDLYKVERTDLVAMIKLLPDEVWPHCSDAARMRVESMLISSIKEGLYDKEEKKCVAGAVGTWATHLMPSALLKGELQVAVASLLESADSRAAAYAFKYILPSLREAISAPNLRLRVALKSGLNRGDLQFKEGLKFIEDRTFDPETFDDLEDFAYPDWRTPLLEAFSEFTVQNQDDIPF